MGGLAISNLISWVCHVSKGHKSRKLLWVLEQFNHGRYKIHWQQAWKRNREELSEIMRDCLYYFTNFPLGYEIPARRLINLWVGEGLVQPVNEKTPEKTEQTTVSIRLCI